MARRQNSTALSCSEKTEATHPPSNPTNTINAVSKDATYALEVDLASKVIKHASAQVDVTTFDSGNSNRDSHAMEVIDADLNGEKKKAIFTTPPSRIKWKTHVPDDGWLKVDLGLKPEAWEKDTRFV